MVTKISHNEHASSQYFLLVLWLEMEILYQRNVPYEPDEMISKQSWIKLAERRKSSAFKYQTLTDIIRQDKQI